MISGDSEPETPRRVRALGAAYFSKPYGLSPCGRLWSNCWMSNNRPIPRPLKTFCPILAVLLTCSGIQAQEKTDLQQILGRLDRLEEENHKLADEIHALRTELAAAKEPAQGQVAQSTSPPEAPLEERVQVAEQRTADLSQEKVEALAAVPGLAYRHVGAVQRVSERQVLCWERGSDGRLGCIGVRDERSDHRADGARSSL